MRCQVIVVFDLRGELLAGQPEVLDEFISQFDPVGFGEGNMMRIEITRGTAEFPGKRYANELFHLVLDPADEYHEFFSQGCGTCRLSMRMSQHRDIFPF